MFERDISRKNVKSVLLSGEVIKEYAEDTPFPSILLYKKVNKRPLHVVASFNHKEKIVYIITAYEPSEEYFEHDYVKKRK